MRLNYYIFAVLSLLAGIICLFLSRSKKFSDNLANKYGEAPAQKLTRSLKIWGYFLVIGAGLLILSLLFEGAR